MRSVRLKRALDVVVAGAALVMLAAPMAGIALAVWLSMGRPVLFTQLRPGLGGQLFSLYKFRSMRDARDARGRLLPDAERLTPLGRFLRRTSLDELPELLNVLKGDMSLVGPRPLLPEYLPLYNHEQARRHEMRPGITGLAQIDGRNALTWQRKFELDVWYINHWSLWLDLGILCRTVAAVLTGAGVSQPGCATSEDFLGNPDL
jgi:sugar transferase EpsL